MSNDNKPEQVERTEKEIRKFIFSMPPELYDILYDLDLMPEQISGDTRRDFYMMRTTILVMEFCDLRQKLAEAQKAREWIEKHWRVVQAAIEVNGGSSESPMLVSLRALVQSEEKK